MDAQMWADACELRNVSLVLGALFGGFLAVAARYCILAVWVYWSERRA